MSYFLYKLIPPRPTFGTDMNEREASAMREHVAYWRRLLDAGTALVFGPVADPAGGWGLGVVRAETEADVQALAAADPAVSGGVAGFEIYPMPGAIAVS